MELILWRHAEAEDSQPDLARKLTRKGEKQAANMAAFLNRRLPAETRILVSPAVRAQQTALALSANFTTIPEIAPNAIAQELLQAAHWPHAGGTVLIVGHQPALGAVVAELLGCEHDSFRIKKGGICWLSRGDGLSDTALRLVISPEFL